MKGSATIRGTEFLASSILVMMAEGKTKSEILEQHPFLEQEDISATFKFAIKLLQS
jgi:uncharacterized protein (DUF433 family)